MGHDPNGMQSSANTKMLLLKCRFDQSQSIFLFSFKLLLRGASFEVAFGIQPLDQVLLLVPLSPFLLVLLGSHIRDPINTPAAAPRALAVAPVGNEQRAVAIDDEVGGL